MKGKLLLITVFAALFLIFPLQELSAENLVKIANVDNFIMHRHLSKEGIYSNNLELALDNGIIRENIFGTSWGNKKQIDAFSLAEKSIKGTDGNYSDDYAYLGKNTRVKKVDYPYEQTGWTVVSLSDLNGKREVIIEIEGGTEGDVVHQQVGNIGVKRPDGIVEDIPLEKIGLLGKKEKKPVLVVSEDYLHHRKHKGDIQELLDEELGWKYGFQILIARTILEEFPGEDDRFTVQAVSSEGTEYSDTVLIKISLDKKKLSGGEIPTILIGWKTVEEVDEGGDSEGPLD